ncbi:hypothetical protein RYX36_026212 [Vicia faba]
MRFQHLESLSLCGCTELNDSGLTRLLSYGSNLQKLNLDCCLKVTDYGLSLVASGCPSLTSISLYRCINISDDGLETLATACLSLKCINLSYCSQISDKGLKALTQRCRQLQAVNISHCESIRGVGFKGCSKSLTHVEAWSCKLNPEGVTGIISGGGIEYLDVSCLSWYPLGDTLLGIRLSSNLKVLNFRMCRSVSDTSIVAIAMGCTLLEEWNLALCHEVRISGWQAVGLYCQNLKTLHVNRCRNLNDNGLQALRDGCRSLSVLYLNGCVHVTPFALELFKSHRANVCIKDEEKALPLPDQVDNAINYIKSLETNLKLAKEKKESLMRSKRLRSGCSSSTGAKGSIKSPKIEIHENGSSLQVIVTCGVDEQFIFCEIMRILHEDRVEVISANSSLVGDSVIHVVHAENPQLLFQYGATKVGERLKRFVNGSVREVQIEPQLWDSEIETETWDLSSIVNKCLPNSL